jgi:DNA topoisomerase I
MTIKKKSAITKKVASTKKKKVIKKKATTKKNVAKKAITKKKTVAKKATTKKTKSIKMNKNLKLLIVESPAKIKTISKFLGKEFRIMSTFGHIKDLPPKKLGVTIDVKNKNITLEYVPIKDKAETIDSICNQARGVGEVYLASDPDREGEIISWHIGQEIAKVFHDKSKIFRISFNEITQPAVVAAIDDKGTINMKQVRAQQARRVLDRWVGYEVSPILWRKIAKGLSAGRVQSVALLIVCNREEEIINFKPEEWWSIHGLFKLKGAELDAELFKINNKAFKLKNKEEADKALAEIKKQDFAISKITEKKRAKNPLPPFMTSTLQQDAYNKLGFSVDKTMSVAQKLYEGIPLGDKDKPEALITYMRTDSLRISDTALKATRKYIKNKFGADYLPKTSNIYSKKGAQDAHEAIRPINPELTPQFVAKYLTPEQAKLYTLIWKRFVACQMSPAQYFQRQVQILGGKYLFKITGSSLVFDGFLKVYLVEEDEKDIKIPKDIKEKDPTPLKKADNKQHFTQPPPRYSQATLVKELERLGIGRPSTYAATLSTIQKRKYVTVEKKRFQPTELGKAVTKMLTQNLPDIINVKFTAHMEEDLDKIADGKIKRDDVLFEFYDKFQEDLEKFGGKVQKQKALEIDLKCPKCGKSLVIRFGKTGEFIGCSGYPECNFTSNFKRTDEGKIELIEEEKTEQVSELKCPNCGKNLVRKIGRFGPFWACPGYPECKYIHQESLKMPCPECGSKLVKRRWKGGSFWGCSNYPKCKFAIFGEVEETKCPKCNSSYLLVKKDKEGNITLNCPNKECDYTKKK